MRTIIAGSRDCTDPEVLEKAVENAPFEPTVVISGCARGVDRLGESWARAHGVPIERFPANWVDHGKSAGYWRNVKMADHAEALIAVWDGESKGTAHMIGIAKERGLEIYIHLI